MNINIERRADLSPSMGKVEIVERKGAGHPDTICDRAAEELSISLSKYYVENFGRVLHHNVDKCVLAELEMLPFIWKRVISREYELF